ncbi:Crp/Fnr family transcriptional regulator [Rivihabitans pingtungensis]|jgi:CRP-like cAMP-binding protein|uniref:Crp/Fnr family transcriptional regulator n=1 Tax=Rivihabitans pingtungensis TaxID=1054498 RepID=UPI0028984B20|nr:Crp/Fnr family transcriptional regulator [Rivihabitans pingtungensis]
MTEPTAPPAAATPSPVQDAGASAQLNQAVHQVITVHLNNIPLLSGLSPQVLQQVGAAMQFRTVEKGTYVMLKGSPGEHLVFVLSGRVQVVDVTEDGREMVLATLAPGDYVGEMAVIDNQPRSASVLAADTSLVAFLPSAQARQLLYGQPLVAERVMRRLAATVRSAAANRAILSLPSAFQRVYAALEQLSQPAPGNMREIPAMPTQQEIAAMVNTSRETVSRALNVLLQKQIVEKDLRRLIVRQPDTLRKMAQEDPAPGPAGHAGGR